MPLVALLPALIGAGGGIAGALINKSASKSSSGSSGPLLPAGLDQNALLKSINAQGDLAKNFSTQGAHLMGTGEDTQKLPTDYHKAILGGDRQKILEFMAPEVAAVNSQFRAPLAEAMISGRDSTLAPDLEAQRQSAISNELFKARPAAADKLMGIAQGLMSLGFNSQAAGAGAQGDVSKELLDYNSIIRGIQSSHSTEGPAMWASLARSLGPVVAKVIGGLGDDEPEGTSAPPITIPDWNDNNVDLPGPGGGLNGYTQYGSAHQPDFFSAWLRDQNNA